MQILVTGKGGNSGSWKIRAEQLGRAIGANIEPMAAAEDCKKADIIIVVKRTPSELINNIRESGRPWVYDIVDGWPQGGRAWNQKQSVQWLQETLNDLKPSAVVFGTAQMLNDSCYIGKSLVLPHHSWDRYVDAVPRTKNQITTVGYEGSVKYLGKWLKPLEKECRSRGWDLHLNGDMKQADVGVCLRDGGGYPAQFWKPGTKLSNLHALGIPALCSIEAGYKSVACGEELWIKEPSDITKAFDSIASYHVRARISRSMRNSIIKLENIAQEYKAWLSHI